MYVLMWFLLIKKTFNEDVLNFFDLIYFQISESYSDSS